MLTVISSLLIFISLPINKADSRPAVKYFGGPLAAAFIYCPAMTVFTIFYFFLFSMF